MRKIIPVLLIIFSIMMTACVSVDPQQGALDPTGLPAVVTANLPEKPTAESARQQPAAVPPAEIAPIPQVQTGTWLVSVLEENNVLLRAISPDGKQILELGAIGNAGTTHFASSAKPDQPWFSLYSSDDNGLTLMRIPTDKPNILLVLLTSKDLQSEQKIILQKEFLRYDQPAQVWSPDGNRLVYLDVPTRTKTRLMLYDISTGNSNVLNQTAEDVIAPIWSPDGQWILYQTIDGFTAQGLPQVTGMHAIRANGSEDRLLYTPSSLRETVLGWASPDTFVVQSLIERGNRDLRLVSLKDGNSLSLNAGLIKNAGWDEKTQTAMYLLTASETNNEQPSGVYAVTASTPQRMVLPGKWESLQHFSPSGVWIAIMPGEAGLILPDGSTSTISGVYSVAGVSPDGKLVLLNQTGGGLGLFSSDGKLLVKVSEKPVEKGFFSPDNQRFFYTVGYAGFMAASPDWKPQPRLDFSSLVGWVGY